AARRARAGCRGRRAAGPPPWAAISGRSSRSWRSSKSWLLQLVRVRALEARGVGSSAQQLVRRERQEFVEALALGHLLDEARRGREHAVGEARRADLMVNAVELGGEQPVEALDRHRLPVAGARAMMQALPQLRPADLRGGRILHQVIERHAAVAAQPGLEVLHAHADAVSQACFRDLAL